jgi:HSP20 family protein
MEDTKMAFGTMTRSRNPWSDLLALQQEMDRLIGSTMGESRSSNGLSISSGLPAVDVLRNEDEVIVRADIPGVSKENLEVTVLKNRLFIRGEKKHKHEGTEGNTHRMERFYGSFERAIDLPVPVTPESMKASFQDGVLEVRAPISEEARPRRIAIEVK